MRQITTTITARAALTFLVALPAATTSAQRTSVGRAVEASEPQVRLASRTKGARLSLARVGCYYWQKVSTRLRLTAQFVRQHLPPPRLRMFKWPMAPQR